MYRMQSGISGNETESAKTATAEQMRWLKCKAESREEEKGVKGGSPLLPGIHKSLRTSWVTDHLYGFVSCHRGISRRKLAKIINK